MEKLKKQRKETLTIASESENQTKRGRLDTICQEWGDIAEDLERQTKMPSWVNLQSLDVELQKEWQDRSGYRYSWKPSW